MKKSLLMLGLAVAAMTSCTNDEVVEVNQSNAIQFESFVNKGARSTTDVVNTSFNKFYVYGNHGTTPVNDFTNTPVSYSDSKWGYITDSEEARYWTTAQYYFGAYADGNGGELVNQTAVSFANGTLTFTDYTVSDEKDLVASLASKNVTGLESSPGTVDFTFKHMLSKVKFTFTNKYNLTGITMDISDLQIAALKNQGTCTFSSQESNPSWVLTANAAVTAKELDDKTSIAIDATYSDSCFVMPQTIDATYLVSFNVTYKNASGETVGQKAYSNIKLSGTGNNSAITKWEPGLVYNYTASLPMDPNIITFTATVSPWTEQEDSDIDKNGEGITF